MYSKHDCEPNTVLVDIIVHCSDSGGQPVYQQPEECGDSELGEL